MKKSNYMKWLLSAMLAFALALGTDGYAQQRKSNLKILYVGGTTDYYVVDYKNKTMETIEADGRKRMAYFEDMLKTYFNQVTVVHAKNYKAELSVGYDVTVMDGVPGSKLYHTDYNLKEGSGLVGENVNTLSDDFNYPMLFIVKRGTTWG